MATVSVNPPKTPVTDGSNGIAAATVPNICKMPGPPAPFIPTPLPNIGKSGNSPKDYSQKVTIEGSKVAIKGATFKSMGDVASKGTGGGLISSNTEGPTAFVGPGSMDVKIEGKNVQLLSDPMLNNCGPSGSPPNAATLMGVMQATNFVTAVDGKDLCPLCKKDKHSPLDETKETKADAGKLAKSFDQTLDSKGLKDPPFGTMLGVIYCKCGTPRKYAQKSGQPMPAFSETVQGMKEGDSTWRGPPSQESQSAADRLKDALKKKKTKDAIVGFQKGQDAFQAKPKTKPKSGKRPAAYPPGSCAAQKALVLLLSDGGHPTAAAMTEQWFHSDGERRGEPVKGLIEFFDARDENTKNHRIRNDENAEENDIHTFKVGDTVPPCRTCAAVLPYLLCPDGEGDKCPHE